jgi:P27 family predicted phage terminase small subunit
MPARKPTRLKILEGNPGKRPLNDREPMPKRGRPKCPPWLDAEAKRKWKALIPELDRIGLLTLVDGDALAAYCRAWSAFRTAAETLAREGHTVETAKGGTRAHPAANQLFQAMSAIRQFAALFGLDPSSRGKLSVSAVTDERDELERFLDYR